MSTRKRVTRAQREKAKALRPVIEEAIRQIYTERRKRAVAHGVQGLDRLAFMVLGELALPGVPQLPPAGAPRRRVA